MPPYTAKVVTDQDLADIYAFLLTIPQPPPIESVPIFSENEVGRRGFVGWRSMTIYTRL